MKRREPGAFERAGVMAADNGATSGGRMPDKKDLHFGGESGILNKGDDSVFKLIEGEHSVQQDLAAVNPNFGTWKPEDTLNCGNCTAAFEMRRRGFDVEATPREGMQIAEWKGLFEGFMPEVPIGKTTAEVVAEIEQKILQWGEGARGTIFGEWKEETELGHFFSTGVMGGKVMFVDGQNDQNNVKWYLDMMKPSSLIFGRLDNLKPTEVVNNAVKNKEG